MPATQTPREVDTKLAELHGELAQTEQRLSSLRSTIIAASGARYYYRGRQRVTDRTYDEAEAICRAALAEDRARLLSYGAERIERGLDVKLPALVAEVARLYAAIDAEQTKYTGWSRFFIVTSSPGHIHSSMHCSTCRLTTTYGWLPSLSGKSEAEAVAACGPTLCTVCFPSAPLDWTTGKKLTAAQAAKKIAELNAAPQEETTVSTAAPSAPRADVVDIILSGGLDADALEAKLQEIGTTAEDLEAANAHLAAQVAAAERPAPKKRPRYSDDVKLRSQALSAAGARIGPDVVAAVEAATIAAAGSPVSAAALKNLVITGEPDPAMLAAAKAQCKWVTPTNFIRCLRMHADQLQMRNAA